MLEGIGIGLAKRVRFSMHPTLCRCAKRKIVSSKFMITRVIQIVDRTGLENFYVLIKYLSHTLLPNHMRCITYSHTINQIQHFYSHLQMFNYAQTFQLTQFWPMKEMHLEKNQSNQINFLEWAYLCSGWVWPVQKTWNLETQKNSIESIIPPNKTHTKTKGNFNQWPNKLFTSSCKLWFQSMTKQISKPA